MGDRSSAPFGVFDVGRPPKWFDVAGVVGDRTLAEISDLRAELERLLAAARAVSDRWRVVDAAVEQHLAATLARAKATGASARGYDAAFATWTRAASGLGELARLCALITRELGAGAADGAEDEPALPLMVDGGRRA
jgi:hypothetical protein